MSFHKNPKRCDLIRSLNGAKAFPFQLNVRYHPSWARARSSNGETAFSVKFVAMSEVRTVSSEVMVNDKEATIYTHYGTIATSERRDHKAAQGRVGRP